MILVTKNFYQCVCACVFVFIFVKVCSLERYAARLVVNLWFSRPCSADGRIGHRVSKFSAFPMNIRVTELLYLIGEGWSW